MSQRGQASVEFALIVPLILVALLTVVQVGVIVYGQLSVTFAAREAARVIAAEPSAALDELADHHGLELRAELIGQDRVQVVARHEITPISPLFVPFVDGRAVEAVAVMALE